MNEEVFISGRKDKAAAQLKRIFTQLVLLVSRGFGARAVLHVVAAQQMKDVGFLQFQLAIGFAVFVNEQGE